MQVPVEIAFHHMEPSASIEDQVRDRVAKLERLYGHLTTCRVRIEKMARRQNETVPPVVHIEMGIPGRRDLVVSYEPGRLQQRFRAPNIRNAINDAFHVAERRLIELKNQRSRRTKLPHHDARNQHLGSIAEIFHEEDHGFILTAEGSSLYFHRNALLSGDFDGLAPGDAVYYVETIGDTGPIATKVRMKSNNG